MNKLHIPHTALNLKQATAEELAGQMQGLTKQELPFQPWRSFPYKPFVQFSITHNGDCIALKYEVDEEAIRAVNTTINGSVWEDSCVEFFISFDNTGYYNFEFNCIGTALVGFGKNKTHRELLPEELIRKISTHTTQHQTGKGFIHWELTAVIPTSVFRHHLALQLQGLQCRANFYKCGDLLPKPHFVTWNNIVHPEPDFHLPEFFGELLFE